MAVQIFNAEYDPAQDGYGSGDGYGYGSGDGYGYGDGDGSVESAGGRVLDG